MDLSTNLKNDQWFIVGTDGLGDQLLESRVRVHQVPNIVQHVLTGRHHEPDTCRVAVEDEPPAVWVDRDPARQEVVVHQDTGEGIFELLDHRPMRMVGVGTEEVDGLDVEVEDLVDVGEEHGPAGSRLSRVDAGGAVDGHLQVLDHQRRLPFLECSHH